MTEHADKGPRSAMPVDPRTAADRLVAQICLLRSNQHYRVADVVFNRGFRWEDSAGQVMARAEFDDTILKRYLLANGGCVPTNLPLLARLIAEARDAMAYPVPDADELVIHIRAGDVVEHDWFLSRDLAAIVGDAGQPRKCTIVTSFAFQEWPDRGAWLFSHEKLAENRRRMCEALVRLLDAIPDLALSVYSHDDVDRDMTYLAHAARFVPDHGGFSELMVEVQPLVLGQGARRHG